MTDGVVLLHGIFRTHRSMQPLARFLEKHGYKVHNSGYPSTRHSLEDIPSIIAPDIHAFAKGCEGKIHFIGYSMGGLLIRSYLKQYPMERLGRIVMAGTPNGGSEVADFVKNWWVYKKFYGPAGQQLITNHANLQHLFGELNYEVGIIAGNRSIDPLGSYIIGGENDGKVSVESTRLEGMKAHVVIPVSHTFMPTNRKMWELALEFIQQGEMSGL